MTKPDIVERLRNQALPDPNDEREVVHAPLLREAADLIEALWECLELSQQACDESGEWVWCAICGITSEHDDRRHLNQTGQIHCPVLKVEQLTSEGTAETQEDS